MADLHDGEGLEGVIDRVENSVAALSDAELVLTRQFLATRGAWMDAQPMDPRDESPSIFEREPFEFLRSRRLDEKLIACHGA